jgi:putative aldouronate transport system permease protein
MPVSKEMRIMTAIRIKKRKRIEGFELFLHIAFGLASAVFLYPIYYQFIASISNPGLVVTAKLLIFPLEFTTKVYQMMLDFQSVWTGYKNSLINLALYVSCTLVATIGVSHALSRPNLWGKKAVMLFFVLPMFLSGGMVPMFITVPDFGLYNSRWALVFPYLINTWNMLMARAYLKANISSELYEASIIDGAGEFRFFFLIVLPLSKAIMAVLILYYGAASWNSFFKEMLYLNDRSLYPLQLVLREILILDRVEFTMDSGTESAYLWQESVKYAVTVISIAPLLALFPFVQRYFVKGVMVGSLKG